jgi:GNAT superfamily N-acetyltransferase
VRAARRADVTIRPYETRDEPAVLELLDASLGGGPTGERSAAFFRWKHLENPFGASLMLVADDDGRVVGLRAFMRWRFAAGGREIRAVRGVDTATHPDHQGRGIFSRLTREALEILHADTDLVFNTPNEKSLPGYLKMGWRTVGRVPVRLHVRHPVRFARRVRDRRALDATASAPAAEAPPAADVLAGGDRLEALVTGAERSPGIATPRTLAYLRWRYGATPGLDYRAIVRERGGAPAGLAVFRVRPRGALWESTLAELLVAEGDTTTARRLMSDVATAAEVDEVACSFPPRSAAARGAALAGSVRTPGGITLAANPLAAIEPDPTDLRSWALSIGDLEVF